MAFISNKSFLLNAVSTEQLTLILLITAGVFLVFIVMAIIKMYKLNAENKRLIENDAFKIEIEEGYRDFTQGHLYDDN